jgi:hypothetical protein
VSDEVTKLFSKNITRRRDPRKRKRSTVQCRHLSTDAGKTREGGHPTLRFTGTGRQLCKLNSNDPTLASGAPRYQLRFLAFLSQKSSLKLLTRFDYNANDWLSLLRCTAHPEGRKCAYFAKSGFVFFFFFFFHLRITHVQLSVHTRVSFFFEEFQYDLRVRVQSNVSSAIKKNKYM